MKAGPKTRCLCRLLARFWRFDYVVSTTSLTTKFHFVFTFGGFAIPATDPENNLREFDRELQILISPIHHSNLHAWTSRHDVELSTNRGPKMEISTSRSNLVKSFGGSVEGILKAAKVEKK